MPRSQNRKRAKKPNDGIRNQEANLAF